MAAVTPTLRVTYNSQTRLVTTSWTATDQQAFKVSFTRTSPTADAEPTYGTERYKGQFARTRDLQAHLVTSGIDRIVWDGSGFSSDRICTGTWRVAFYYINTDGERSRTVEANVTVSGVPCSSSRPDPDERQGGELPAFTFNTPSNEQEFDGVNVTASWTLPAGHTQGGAKVSVYRKADVDADFNPVDDASPVYGTIGRESDRTSDTRSHYFSGATSSITFSATSAFANGPICAGEYVMRGRWRDAYGTKSGVAIREFSVVNVECPQVEEPTPLDPDPPAITPGTGGRIDFVGGNEQAHPFAQDLTLEWSAVFESGLPMAAYELKREVELYAGFDTGTRRNNPFTVETDYFLGSASAPIWSDTYTQANNRINTGTQAVRLRGGDDTTSTWATDRLNRWFNNRWAPFTAAIGVPYRARVVFKLTAYDTAGTATQEATLTLTPYMLLAAPSGSNFFAAIGTDLDGVRFAFVRLPTPGWSRDIGFWTNNSVQDLKIAVYTRNSDGSRGGIVAGTTRFRGQGLEATGAHFTPYVGSQASNLTFDMRASPYFTGPPAGGGAYIVAARFRDIYGNGSPSGEVHYDHSLVTPRTRDIFPFRIVSIDPGEAPVIGPPRDVNLFGLQPGEGIAIGYYVPSSGIGIGAQFQEADDEIIEVREFARQDGRPLNTEPRVIFTRADRVGNQDFLAWPTIYTILVPTGTYWWYIWLGAASRVEYQFRLTLIDTRSGGRLVRDWMPL